MNAKKTAKNLTNHAAIRLWQRYGIKYHKELQRLFAEQIRGNEASFVRRDSLSRVVWDLTYNGEVIRAVYDKPRGCIVTFLPKEVIT